MEVEWTMDGRRWKERPMTRRYNTFIFAVNKKSISKVWKIERAYRWRRGKMYFQWSQLLLDDDIFTLLRARACSACRRVLITSRTTLDNNTMINFRMHSCNRLRSSQLYSNSTWEWLGRRPTENMCPRLLPTLPTSRRLNRTCDPSSDGLPKRCQSSRPTKKWFSYLNTAPSEPSARRHAAEVNCCLGDNLALRLQSNQYWGPIVKHRGLCSSGNEQWRETYLDLFEVRGHRK